uniref:Putative TAFII55 protein, conserved region n=1 Tax=Helianthus annuus TaxID=4232 RepID=A0A251VQ38_HELAN
MNSPRTEIIYKIEQILSSSNYPKIVIDFIRSSYPLQLRNRFYHFDKRMEEQFILRVPPSVAERIDRLLDENASDDKSLDLSFSDDGRNGTFVIGDDHFPASLLDLPGIVESYKTYDDSVLIKTADVGQIIMVRDEGDPAPDVVEYRHGLTPPMRDARRRRFRREPDLNGA